MKKLIVIVSLGLLVIGFSQCHKAEALPDEAFDESAAGGLATTLDATSHAFGVMIEGLNARDERVHALGDATFGAFFVAPPAPVFGGLGPIFNNVSCLSCHRNDGGGLPTAGASNSGLLMRISQVGKDPHGAPLGITGFGIQVQDHAILGSKPEANVDIQYTEVPFTYPDGETATLRHPTYSLLNPYIPIPAAYMLSPRLAPRLVGMGLLEKIPESTIQSFVDSSDANSDGITGRANYVYDSYTGKTEIGRFGLKSNTPSLLVQVATAYQQDMGVTCYVAPQESSYAQEQLHTDTSDARTELPDSSLNYVTFYIRTLAVPARRNVLNADVVAGKALFNQLNCSGCHRPTVNTGFSADIPQLSGQRIHPYTDLLLHDMGEGLADNRPDFLASGREWRTAPLWGLGLLYKASGAFYLHDGRARTIGEAVLWHDGEAKKSRDAFVTLTATERAQLIAFLNSL